ncbi:stalk domain-containing protein [Peptoniphilus equinus]|uniref:Stalk domain-containing protein n=1 Tax=Peptoniphilus equinus TaxID=3016343 RepID=A0ABY7QTD5_9FIRM|nr:stalk domain-containing protein [Peptoniphilus equinus]WBW49545.1 stalk domain-containing protein [Peptoniphilus equinus]
MKRLRYSIYVIALLCVMVLTQTTYAEEVYRETFSPGATRVTYDVTYDKNRAIIEVLELDLNNPGLDLKVVAGQGKYTQHATVSSMAERTDAEALVNGDYYNTLLQGAPDSASIIDGRLVSSPAVYTDRHTLAITADKRAVIDTTYFEGKVTAANDVSYPIDGLNKSYYWYDGTGEYSHENKIQVYNDFWASASRGDEKNTEVLVNANGVVEAISPKQSLPYAVPDGKLILQVSAAAEDFVNQNIKVGDTIKVNFGITPNDNYQFLIGGHALLVDKGQSVPYTKDINVLGGRRARTAVGVSADHKMIYLIAAEGRTDRSKGLTLGELSDFMTRLGVERAMNLDGGGSTAMVVKNLGNTERTRVINPEKNAAERKVVSGIGIYNTLPKTGQPQGIKFTGPDTLVIGESGLYQATGAWDTNLHPMDISSWGYHFETPSDLALVSESYLLALQPGNLELALKADNGLSATKQITIQGYDAIKTLTVTTDKKRIAPGETLHIQAEATLSDGRKVILSPRVLDFMLTDMEGSWDSESGNLLITSTGNGIGHITLKGGGIIQGEAKLFDTSVTVIEMTVNKKAYTVNDTAATLDAAPFIQDSRTLVPVRFVAEALGLDVAWDEATKQVTLQGAKTLKLTIGSNAYIVDGVSQAMDTNPLIKDSRTFVPIRFIAEALGLDVAWDEATKQVTLINIPQNLKATKTPLADAPSTPESKLAVPTDQPA